MATEDSNPLTPPPNEVLLPLRLSPEGDADVRVLVLNGCMGAASVVRKWAAKESPDGGRLLLSLNKPDVEPGGRGMFLGRPLISGVECKTNQSAIEILKSREGCLDGKAGT
ncbi:hypothetical protein ARMSODRAFT_1024426 [Armillaria solidipes]|uniref:Uncharacterized protein n=1 Tax=Armillaria solidipes TaxID=1076256 RepID=A0A2H3BII1_9AGAR|nr:hypothetical protein ARMSODRAFT_1024426 [Armillaria solidipes]